jgi:hypothetical protein
MLKNLTYSYWIVISISLIATLIPIGQTGKATYCFLGLNSISLPKLRIVDFNSEYIALILSSTDSR